MHLNNKYYILRHGEALSNVREVMSCWPEKFENLLTGLGREMIKVAAETLNKKGIDLIFASDVLRTKQTAEIVSEKLNLPVNFDKRLREVDFGSFNGKAVLELDEYFKKESDRIKNSIPGGESYEKILKRINDFLKEIDSKYQGKNILVVTHGFFWWILKSIINGVSLLEAIEQDR